MNQLTVEEAESGLGDAKATPDQSPHKGMIKVWDPLVRVFHWSLAAGFATAYVTEGHPIDLHVWVGYGVLALISIRVVWGFVGTRRARFSDFVRGPRAISNYLRAALQRRAPHYAGHNPAGGAMTIALLLLVAATGVSGLALYGAEEFSGPLAGLFMNSGEETAEVFESLHELFANLTLAFIVVHVAGVLLSSWAHKENLVRSMFTGRKRGAA